MRKLILLSMLAIMLTGCNDDDGYRDYPYPVVTSNVNWDVFRLSDSAFLCVPKRGSDIEPKIISTNK